MSKILFVDDEPVITRTLIAALRRTSSDHETRTAGNVDEGLDILRAEPIDVIVTDVHMPGKSGFDLLMEVRADDELSHIPIIVVTGAGDQEMKRRAIQCGADDLLAKPVSIPDFLARLKNALRLKRYQDELRGQKDALEIAVRERTRELELSRVELLWRLGVAGEYRDNETGNHVLRVGYFARELARRLGMEKDTCETLFLAAPLHDIGKIGIPDGILLKPGKLTDEEWVTMRRHAEYGARILRSRFVDPRALDRGQTAEEGLAPTNPLMEMAANIAEGHHERWDGTGYPKGLAGEDIPIEARITAVADVYDALRSVRPYKPAYPQEKVLRIMRESSGNHFDPGVYEAFVASLKNFAEISEHLEDTEEEVRKTPQERHA